MPRGTEVIRTAVEMPLAIVRRLPGGRAVARLVDGLLPGRDAEGAAEERVRRGFDAGTPDVEPSVAAADALARNRDAAEQAAPADDVLGGHVESEVELVGESSDVEATDPPGAQLHVDEPWEGYRRMKVAEIVTRLEGQPAEVLAAVELYEATHRSRRGVLEAVRAATRG